MRLIIFGATSIAAREPDINQTEFSISESVSGNTVSLASPPIETHGYDEGSDIFYPKRLLKHLASLGQDVTNLKPAVTAGGDAVRSTSSEKAAANYHRKWYKNWVFIQ